MTLHDGKKKTEKSFTSLELTGFPGSSSEKIYTYYNKKKTEQMTVNGPLKDDGSTQSSIHKVIFDGNSYCCLNTQCLGSNH